ncbi:hypothetical protein LCGC14_2181630 [marine sediment metagenome]|uniref:LamG-like jellyroll fold domain-containing protein n=1 Tax=marine sediment metagenome TaxID=412755 RepID=A0A0F9DMA2_9ZZZZ
MSIITSTALRYPKSLWSYNPIPTGCVLYLPFWHPSLAGPVFKSIDPFGHTATVSGALYQGDVKGRFFDGATGNDDIITVPSSTGIDGLFDSGGTIITWVNLASDGGGDQGNIAQKTRFSFLCKGEAASKVKLDFSHQFSGDDYASTTTATEITLNQNTHAAITYDNSNTANLAIHYVDAVVVAHSNGTPTGTRNSDAGFTLNIGKHPSVARTIDGNIIEMSQWDRILSPDEITYHRRMSRRNL